MKFKFKYAAAVIMSIFAVTASAYAGQDSLPHSLNIKIYNATSKVMPGLEFLGNGNLFDYGAEQVTPSIPPNSSIIYNYKLSPYLPKIGPLVKGDYSLELMMGSPYSCAVGIATLPVTAFVNSANNGIGFLAAPGSVYYDSYQYAFYKVSSSQINIGISAIGKSHR